ncbi:hypothetical protein MmarC5_0247 [Methanococcus maripaludis C5]|uniref:Uncharacterized protein n=1 Tax=Methanococcus maripaludis (strain C5 / ATCC BAA-1333) TaxID=402880 RepID=A4FWI8_METM5|nr:hypothetical protein MmarC5_0247 [Methanococcus maripaludis C5]
MTVKFIAGSEAVDVLDPATGQPIKTKEGWNKKDWVVSKRQMGKVTLTKGTGSTKKYMELTYLEFKELTEMNSKPQSKELIQYYSMVEALYNMKNLVAAGASKDFIMKNVKELGYPESLAKLIIFGEIVSDEPKNEEIKA